MADERPAIATELRGLIDAYWACAYTEGAEGRTHDDSDGSAQTIRSAIEDRIDALSRRTAPAEPVASQDLDAQALDLTKRIEREFYHDHPGGSVQVRAKVQSIIRSALASPTVSDEMVERATKAALKAIIVPFENGARGAIGENGTTLIDYVEINAASAVELGTVLTEKTATGAPRFHWYSDIAIDEMESAVENLATPIVRAALLAALGGHHD